MQTGGSMRGICDFLLLVPVVTARGRQRKKSAPKRSVGPSVEYFRWGALNHPSTRRARARMHTYNISSFELLTPSWQEVTAISRFALTPKSAKKPLESVHDLNTCCSKFFSHRPAHWLLAREPINQKGSAGRAIRAG